MARTLLVIDMANDFVRFQGSMFIGKSVQEIVPYINNLIEEVHNEKGHIFFVNDCHDKHELQFQEKQWPMHCIKGTWGQELHYAIKDKISELTGSINWPSERVHYLDKSDYNAFHNTNLAHEIRTRCSTDTIEIVGVCTDICVFLTTAGAYANGFKTIVHDRGCATFTQNHQGTLAHMELCFKTRIIP